MTKRERLWATIHGRDVDRVAVAMWRHFPNRDRTSASLAEHTLEFQKRFDFDFIKLTPMGLYGVEDWGTVPRYFPDSLRPPVPERLAVVEEGGWNRIGHLDISTGRYGQELRALKLVREGMGDEVPILQTLFSPMTTALKLGGQFSVESLREGSQEFRRALDRIVDTTIDFARACVRSGADGFFFATKSASGEIMTEHEHNELVRPYDLAVLDALAGKDSMLALHVHGIQPHLTSLLDYPVHILNWHDRRTCFSLRDVRGLTSLCLAGGIDECGTLLVGTPEEISLQLVDAITQVTGRGLILAPGCVVPPECEDACYRIVLDEVRRKSGASTKPVN